MAVQFCVVCGRGSDRVWNNVSGSYVACDFHSQELFQSVVSAAPTSGSQIVNAPEAFIESENG